MKRALAWWVRKVVGADYGGYDRADIAFATIVTIAVVIFGSVLLLMFIGAVVATDGIALGVVLMVAAVIWAIYKVLAWAAA